MSSLNKEIYSQSQSKRKDLVVVDSLSMLSRTRKSEWSITRASENAIRRLTYVEVAFRRKINVGAAYLVF
jgi:archaellum biogenesis ATPase FlaH